MAPSHLSGMEMMSLLFGVLFGLLAVVHSTPAYTVTQDEVYREVVTDGYIIDSHILSPPATAPSVSHAQSSTALPLNTNDSISISNIQTPEKSGSGSETSTASPPFLAEGPGSGSGSGSGLGDFTAEKSEDVYTTITKETSTAFPSFLAEESGSGSGSGLGDFTNEKPEVVYTTTTNEPTSMVDGIARDPRLHVPLIKSDIAIPVEKVKNNTEILDSHPPGEEPTATVDVVTRAGEKVKNNTEPQPHPQSNVGGMQEKSQGHTTPGWIIIVGFIVGLAALVMLCAAIATRDKWNGPKQASQVGTNANSSNQQRELEMETFLHNDKPRENGKAADYIVVPLDDVPENYSSH